MQGRALTPDVILSGNLSVSKTVNLQNKVIYNNGQYEADEGYDGLGKVTVSVHNEMTDLKATENGVYLPPEGYDGFDRVDVDVPDPELDTIHITQNGRYTPPTGVYGYDDIYVDVHLNLESKTITSNGHYEPSQGKNGFSEVTVNVPERVPVIESKSITENGTYTAPAGVDGYSPITVNVPVPAGSVKLKECAGLPAAIASFNDAAALPLNSLTASIVPVQSGSGDPSPTNVRPISGWTEEVITVSPLNLQLYNGQIYGDGSWISNPNRITNVTNSQDNSYFLKKGTYTLDFDVLTQGVRNVTSCSLLTKDENYNIIDNFADSWKSLPFTFTLTQDGYLYFTAQRENANINPSDFRAKILGHTTSIPFTDSQGNPVEVYGGSVDVVNGGGNAYKEYPSYNGETLIGPWISDRDVYAPNTTPTIGAQVVDMGDTTTFYTQPTAVKSLDGDNNMFASTGDVTECEYFTPVQ